MEGSYEQWVENGGSPGWGDVQRRPLQFVYKTIHDGLKPPGVTQTAPRVILNPDEMPVVLYRDQFLVHGFSGMVREIDYCVLSGQFDGHLKPVGVASADAERYIRWNHAFVDNYQ